MSNTKIIRYTGKPVFLDAVQFNNDIDSLAAIQEIGAQYHVISDGVNPPRIVIGIYVGNIGDYIVKDRYSEGISIMRQDIFESVYEKVEDE